MFKGQVKLLVFVKMLSAQYYWLLCLKVAKLVQWMALEKRCSLLIFRSKVKAKLLIFIRSVVYSSSYDSLLDGYQTLLHWLTLVRRLSLLLFGSQGQCQATGFFLLSTQNFLNHMLNNNKIWYSGCHWRVDNSFVHTQPFCIFMGGFLVYVNFSITKDSWSWY